MTPQVRVRDGLPRFAARVAAGEPAAIVAFGTSMTLRGEYLSGLVPALHERTRNDRIALVQRGFRGYGSLHGAFRVESDVLPAAPDLVLLEFAHNEVGPVAVDLVGQTLGGIVAQVRAARPACEFVFVYLAQPGQAAAGPTPAMVAWEAVADALGCPSIDLARPLEALVAAGGATWHAGPAALTADGIHYTPAAAELIGPPFGAAFAALIEASLGRVPQPPAPLPPTPFARTARAPAAAFLTGGPWTVGLPADHAERTADAYDDRVAHPRADGATLRIVATGLHVFAWVTGLGRLEVVRDGAVRSTVAVDAAGWTTETLATAMPPAEHVLEIAAFGPALVLGDVLVAGLPEAAPA